MSGCGTRMSPSLTLALGFIDTGLLFLDNQSVAQSPFNPTPTPVQNIATCARLERDRPKTTLTIQWLAACHSVGNEAADKVAKRVTGELRDTSADAAALRGGKRSPRRRRGLMQGFRPEQSKQESLSGNESEWDKGKERRARDFQGEARATPDKQLCHGRWPRRTCARRTRASQIPLESQTSTVRC